MQSESIELGFLSIFSLLTFFVFLIISKFSNKIFNGVLIDNDFEKPQAFHSEPVSRSGGLASIISLFIFFYFYYLLYSEVLINYILIATGIFFIGSLDDFKIKIKPTTRLFVMISVLFILIYFLEIKIKSIDLIFLNSLLDINFFSVLFTLLCFLFIINGANLIDGFNGLLTINLILINSILLYINLKNDNLEFSIFLIAQLTILICFLMFNFPRAKIFFGDSGSYLFGSLISLNTIITNNLNPDISSFFFCILLSYLFFEVFFSFIRKIYQKKSPFFPDNKHLHMLSYKKILGYFGKEKSNYMNSFIINIVYLAFVLPSVYFAHNPLICKLWFLTLIISYLIIYQRINTTNQNSVL